MKSAAALQNAGIKALVIGATLLLAPLVLPASPMLDPMAAGMRPAAFVSLGIGAVLLLVHALLKRRHALAVQPVEPDGATPKGDVHSSQVRLEPHFPSNAPPTPSSAWGPHVFAAIEWRRFEAVCAALFAQAGFETRCQAHGADGGVDIWLHSKNAPGPVSVVQCKHWNHKPVGVKELREFFGVMASHGIKRGSYATSSRYTPDAQAFAKANGIHALDGAGLLELIAQRSPEQQDRLLEVAYQGEYWRPTCASCGIKLVQRRSGGGNGARFWGCSNFPRCKTKIFVSGT